MVLGVLRSANVGPFSKPARSGNPKDAIGLGAGRAENLTEPEGSVCWARVAPRLVGYALAAAHTESRDNQHPFFTGVRIGESP